MVASQTVMAGEVGDVAEMAARMQAAAAAGDWARVEALTVKVRVAVMALPETEREEMLLTLRRVTQDVQSMANSARDDVTQRLKAIRRGKAATKAYGSGGKAVAWNTPAS